MACRSCRDPARLPRIRVYRHGVDWLLRRRADPESQRPAGRELLPIRLFSADVVVPGRVDPEGDRITDILQRGAELTVLPDGRDPEDPGSWMSVNADAMLLVVPPPHVSRPELRVHRHRETVDVRIGPYRVTGIAHLRPGEEGDPYLRATQPFLPLTDATIEQPGEPPERVEVVIVNFRRIDAFQVV